MHVKAKARCPQVLADHARLRCPTTYNDLLGLGRTLAFAASCGVDTSQMSDSTVQRFSSECAAYLTSCHVAAPCPGHPSRARCHFVSPSLSQYECSLTPSQPKIFSFRIRLK
eukprot:4119626-Amphidinium_carterae.1